MRAESHRSALFAVCLTVAACTPSPTIRTEASPTANFAAYRTYGWVPDHSPPLVTAATGQQPGGLPDWRIRNAVEAGLAARGWAASSAPDVLVDYGVVVKDMHTDTFSGYARYVQEGGSEGMGNAFVSGYQQGTLMLQLYDARTGQLVWRATATAVVGSENSDVVSSAVQEMLAKLPRE